MTIAHPSSSSLTVLFLAVAAAACSSSSKKNDSTVPDASSEVRGGYPSLTTSSTMLSFPRLCPGQASAPETVQIINDGDSAVPVNLKVTGGNAADFTTTETGCDLIAPGAACTIAVVFAPTTTSEEIAILEVTTPGGPEINIALGVFSTGGPAPFSLSPGSSDFGFVTVGTASPAVTFTVVVLGAPSTCSGDIAVVPFTVTLSIAEFVITDDTCSTNVIPIGGTCTFGVVLRPTSAGAKDAPLVLGWPFYTKTYALTGTGISIIDAGPSEPMDSGFEQGEAGDIAIDSSSG